AAISAPPTMGNCCRSRPPWPARMSNRASPTQTTMASAVPGLRLSNRRRRSRSSLACPRRTSRTATSWTASSA
ncbi:hypothetical protein VIGAN_UM065300, partial [Vigna angularis var. angularis]